MTDVLVPSRTDLRRLTLGVGILSVVLGVLAIVTPPATLAAIMALIASFALASAVMVLIGAFRLSAAKAQVTDALRGAKAT